MRDLPKQTFMLFVFMAILLSGCAEAAIIVEVKENYSGSVQIVMGLDQQLVSIAKAQGQDPFQSIIGESENGWSTTEQWIAEGKQWVRLERPFADLAQLGTILDAASVTEGISVVQEGRQIAFEGNLAPYGEEMGGVSGMEAVAAGMVSLRVYVRLPGEIVEVNGIFDRDSEAYAWELMPYEPTAVHIKAQIGWIDYVRNAPGLLFGFLAAGLAAIGVLAVVVVVVVRRQAQRQAQPNLYSIS